MSNKFNDAKMNNVRMFNEILESLLIQMSPLIGSLYHKHFMMIIKANYTLAIEKFLIQALPLREKILNRDETYFQTDNAVSSLVDVETINTKYINNILKLQNIYSKLDKTSRDNVWQIFQSMLILAEEWITL